MLAVIVVSHTDVDARSGPFDGGVFKGRIAISTDGNYNDEDDWAASAVAIAMLDAFGVTDKVVHFDFNCILPKTDARFERENAVSVYGAAERFGISRSVVFDCLRDLDGAIDNIRKAINASSADDPLYFILAGPMEVPCRGIEASQPEKRKHVYCISHNSWNDGYASKDLVDHNKRDVIPTGITWVQIRDQNRLLSTSPYGRAARDSEWQPWLWMRDSGNADMRWVFDRIKTTTRADASDAGMTYFLLCGDEQGDPAKLKSLLENRRIPVVLDPRKTIRIEAENFTELDGCDVEYGDRKASQRLNVKSLGAKTWSITTRFNEPYCSDGRYDIEVRYSAGKGGRCIFKCYVNSAAQGAAWVASGDDETWKTKTILGVTLRSGDELVIKMESDTDGLGEIDYMEIELVDAFGVTGP